MKYIPINISSEKEIEKRIGQIKKYDVKECKIKEKCIDISEEELMQRFMQAFNLPKL